MPLSMVTKEARQLVRQSGYSIVAWALRTFLAQGQQKLVAMMIVTLCLAPRKTKLDNNGVSALLSNFKFRKMAMGDEELMHELRTQADLSSNRNKVRITLNSFFWEDRVHFYPDQRTPWLQINDGCLFLNSRRNRDDHEGFQHMLCDHAGCQYEQFSPHFRMIWDGPEYLQVRVIGRQLAKYSGTSANVYPLPNGYYQYLVPVSTVLYNFGLHSGRTLEDMLEPGVWYDYHFNPATALDIVDHQEEQQLADAQQQIANLAMKFGQLNG